MKKLVFALLAFVALNATAQTKVVNDPNARPRTLSGEFSAVSVATGIELFITQGNETSLAVSVSDEKFEEGFKTEVVNGTLKLYYEDKKSNQWIKGRKLKAYLSVKTLKKLTASSGASVNTVNALNVQEFDLRLSSGSEFEGEIKATSLTVDQSSGSQVVLSGSANDIDVQVSSGASFKGFDFTSDKCKAHASSGADIKITVNKELDASASSGGGIQYKGTVTNTEINKSSGGSVRKA